MNFPLMPVADATDWNWSREAEQSLLGALLLDNTCFDAVGDAVSEQDFYAGEHRAIFRTIARLLGAGNAADVVTVGDALMVEDAHRFTQAGGAPYLATLMQAAPGSANARRYAEIVRDRAMLRRLYSVGATIQSEVTASRGREVPQIIDAAQSAVVSLSESRRDASAEFSPLQKVMGDVLEFVDQQFHRDVKDGVIGVPTGFTELDRMTSGLQGGQLIILAARPAMGKSSFALNVAEHAARKTQRWSLFFTLEMGNREQGLRMLASASGVNVQRLVTGRINDDEWGRVSESMAEIHDLRLAFNERAGLNVNELRALARRAVRECGPLGVIVVDYLQLMLAGETESNRATQIAEISRGLKLLAKELDVPVLALSQLNRELEKRVNKRPVMSDLRDSGALEQDADVIFFIYRDEVYHPNTVDKGIAELIVAKQRMGPVGTVSLRFSGARTRFENLGAK